MKNTKTRCQDIYVICLPLVSVFWTDRIILCLIYIFCQFHSLYKFINYSIGMNLHIKNILMPLYNFFVKGSGPTNKSHSQTHTCRKTKIRILKRVLTIFNSNFYYVRANSVTISSHVCGLYSTF